MRSKSNFQVLFQIALAILLLTSSACIDPNGNLNLVTGATSNSLTSETNENQVETIGSSGSDIVDEGIPAQTGVDVAGEPITMPVTIAKLDSEYLIKATYIRGEAVLDSEAEDYEATLWSWLHGTAIAAEDAKLMVYGAKNCVSPYAKLSVKLNAPEVESYSDTGDSDSTEIADEAVIYSDASEVEAGEADAIVIEADADGAFEFTVPKLWVKREMLVSHLSVPSGEESNSVGVVVGKTGDFSSIITSRTEKIDLGARLMIHNSQVFYDKVDKATGRVSLINCNIDGYNCQTIAKLKSSLNQKIYFTPKDSESFLIGVDDKYNLIKVAPSGVSRLNNKIFEHPEALQFLNVVAPIGAKFALQTVGMKLNPFKMKLIPLKDAEVNEIGLIVEEFKKSVGQSLAWTAASAFHALNIYRSESDVLGRKFQGTDKTGLVKSVTTGVALSAPTK